MTPCRRLAAFFLMLIVVPALRCVGSPTSAPADTDAEPGSAIHIYLLTFGPGDEPWEKYGHNAIRIVIDLSSDEYHDMVFHWGAFQFSNAFFWHFVQGKLIYQMAHADGESTIDNYSNFLHRDIQQQELDLTADQKLRLIRTLFNDYNDPSLRNYHYDYYTDNCSTRVRDAVNAVSDGQLQAMTQGTPAGVSYRFHADRLSADTLWLYVALKGVMGHPVDRPIDQWQEMFLPEKVHDRVNEVMVNRNGKRVKLVKSDVTLYRSGRPAEPTLPPLRGPWMALFGLGFGGVLVLLGRAARRHWAARWGFVLLSLPWLLLMGVGGGLLWWGWLATDHRVARWNENVLHVSVLMLPLLIMLPRLAFGARRGAVFTQRLLLAVAVTSLLGIVIKVLPWFYQQNWTIIALCFPINAALAYAGWVMSRQHGLSTAHSTAGSTSSGTGTRGKSR